MSIINNKICSLKVRLRRGLIAQLLGLILGMHLLVPTALSDNINEYQVKVAFVFNFVAFTQWPNDFGRKLNICIYGEDFFGQEIDILQARSVDDNNIRILRLTSLERSKECQVLFISKSVVSSLPDILASIQGEPVLTIADSPDVINKGVIINMHLIQNKVHFEINLESAHSVGLKISSRLLQLANKVYQ